MGSSQLGPSSKSFWCSQKCSNRPTAQGLILPIKSRIADERRSLCPSSPDVCRSFHVHVASGNRVALDRTSGRRSVESMTKTQARRRLSDQSVPVSGREPANAAINDLASLDSPRSRWLRVWLCLGAYCPFRNTGMCSLHGCGDPRGCGMHLAGRLAIECIFCTNG
jgi:hypothetical protein